jgi:glycosyltransferase involved in cell wall biosynthesis
MALTTSPTVLWWGRFDRAYSRNAVVRSAFESLGWQIQEFRPLVSALGHLQASVLRTSPGSLLWVPCFRQRDIASARRFAAARRIPLVVDPLISAYDKQVGERLKFPADSPRARRLLAWERDRLGVADRVVVDTEGHREYFHEVLGVDLKNLFVIPVGAEERLFQPAPAADPSAGIEALFYGSFLPLQGADTIVRAVRHVSHPGVTFTLLGQGPERARCEALAADHPQIRFEPWLDYAALPARIHRAHLLLGVFAETAKAGRVIPNKVYQALASARPVITRGADAYPPSLLHENPPGLSFVAPGDPVALASAVDTRAAEPRQLAAAGQDARRIYERWFSAAQVRCALAGLLKSLQLHAALAGPGIASCGNRS